PTSIAGGVAAAEAEADEEEDDDEDEDGGDDAWDTDIVVESHWRAGPPPSERAVSFPLERYPEIIEEYDWDDFGIALKLGGPEQPGEESVINAFFALWLSVYQDERTG